MTFGSLLSKPNSVLMFQFLSVEKTEQMILDTKQSLPGVWFYITAINVTLARFHSLPRVVTWFTIVSLCLCWRILLCALWSVSSISIIKLLKANSPFGKQCPCNENLITSYHSSYQITRWGQVQPSSVVRQRPALSSVFIYFFYACLTNIIGIFVVTSSSRLLSVLTLWLESADIRFLYTVFLVPFWKSARIIHTF